MSSNFDRYPDFFSPGQRIRVAIPTAEGDPFHDWGSLISLSGDLAELQLSRDLLPSDAQIHLGTTLELRTGTRGSGYRCRSIVVSLGSEKILILRLIGEVILDELREYFRIDVYIPFRLSVPHGTAPAEIREQWLEKRAATLARQDIFRITSLDEVSDENGGSEWNEAPPPKAANISGGGVRLCIPDLLPPDTLVHLELYLPLHPPVTLNIVGQVLTATRLISVPDSSYSTALSFFHIDERDRDKIIQYITAEQLAQLRQYRKSLEALSAERQKGSRSRAVIIAVAALCVSSLLAFWLISSSSNYYGQKTKSEVQRVFEKGLRDYINTFK